MNEIALLSRDVIERFDYLIRICREKETKLPEKKDMRNLFYQCILSLSGDSDASGSEQQALSFIEEIRNLDNRKQIAVCLLRLAAEPEMKWLTDRHWRPKLISLFDTQFEEDLYVDRKIDTKLLGHEKADHLISIVREIEKNLIRGLGLLTSFEQMNIHRQTLMGVINSKVGRVIVHPFLPVHIEALLGEAYKRIESYLARREDLGILDAYSSAEEELIGNRF